MSGVIWVSNGAIAVVVKPLVSSINCETLFFRAKSELLEAICSHPSNARHYGSQEQAVGGIFQPLQCEASYLNAEVDMAREG